MERQTEHCTPSDGPGPLAVEVQQEVLGQVVLSETADTPTFNDKLLLRLSKNVGLDWKKLAIELGYVTAEIQAFEYNNRDNLQEQCRMMLVEWWHKQTSDEEAREILTKALRDSGRKDLVKQLDTPTFNDKLLLRLSKNVGLDWKKLAIELGYVTAEIQAFEYNNRDNLQEQCRMMLVEWWHKQTSDEEAREILTKALRDSGRKDLVKKLGPSRQHAPVLNLNVQEAHRSAIVIGGAPDSTFNVGHQSPEQEGGRVYNHHPVSSSAQGASPEQGGVSRETILQEASQKLRQNLKDHYTTEGSFVQLNETVDDDQRHMTEIYTELLMEKGDGVADVSPCTRVQNSQERKFRKGSGDKISIKSSDYDKMFQTKTREGKLVDRIVFYGTGGIGKSTIFGKIAYDWATESSEVLAKFKFVFSLKMCALDESSDLPDAILDQLLPEDLEVTKDCLASLINSNEDKVLILLDGFDELTTTKLSPSLFGSILRALNRKKFRKCCICISTRPSRLDELKSKSLVRNPCTHLEVRGFSESGAHEYINKFHKDHTDIADSFILTLRGSNTLRDLSKSPMLLLLMCMLCRVGGRLPETMSRLFAQAVDYMFTRKCTVTENQMSNVLLAIGKVALRGLLASNRQFTYNEDEFDQDILTEALKTGILTRQRVFKSHRSHHSIQFMHTTMQEYCAAKYWQSLHNQSKGFVNTVLGEHHVNRNEFQQILEHACRDNPKRFKILLWFCCGDNEICTRDILGCLIEYDRKDIQKLVRRCYFEAQLSEAPRRSYIRSMVPDELIVDGDDGMRALDHVLANMCRSNESAEHLARISAITMSDISQVTHVVPFINKCVNLNRLELEGNRDRQLGNNASWIPSLLTPMKQLEKLVLEELLGDGDVEHITLSFGRMENLAELGLGWNPALGGTAKSWAHHLPLLKQLEELDISNCSLQCEEVEHIASSVGRMEKLTDLDLSGNTALGGTAGSWAHHLPLMKQLKELDISDCSLQCEHVEHIASYVGRMKKLTDLNLGGNTAFGGTAESWAHHLPLMKQLEELDISDCSLQCEDVEHIASSIGRMEKLTDLDLSGNTALGGTAESWAHHLRLMKQLKELDISNCLLQGGDVEHIASSVGRMEKLTDLDISGNTALGGTAESWAHHLPLMKQLEELHILKCSLQGGDIEHITSSVERMEKLMTDLDLF